MTNHRTRKKLRATQAPAAVVDAALVEIDQARLAAHGDWVIPGGVRRLQRHSVRDQLFAARKITAAEWQAADDYARDYELALGARDNGPKVGRVDGGGDGAEMAIWSALGRRRRLRFRLGPPLMKFLDAALGEAISRRALALRFVGRDDGRAYDALDAALAQAFRRLAGAEARKSA